MAKLNREKLALNILTCSTIREAAEKSGVSESTAYRLKKDTEFQDTLNKVKNSMFQDTIQKAQGYCLDMLEVLKNIANDKTATDSSRVSAARTVLELGLQTRNTELVQQELEEVKRMVMQNEGS